MHGDGGHGLVSERMPTRRSLCLGLQGARELRHAMLLYSLRYASHGVKQTSATVLPLLDLIILVAVTVTVTVLYLCTSRRRLVTFILAKGRR